MNLANKYTSRCTVLSNYVTCANRKQRKLIWLKKTALTGIASPSKGKYDNLDKQESAITEKSNEMY